MDRQAFEAALRQAQTRRDLGDAHYWEGYARGLRRAYYGAAFGTEEEHRCWLALVADEEPWRRDRGRGYVDGLGAKRDATVEG